MKKIKQYTRSINEIYPIYLVLLIFTPIILGLFIDYDLFDSRAIAINLVWIPLFTIPYLLSKKKIIYYITSSLFFFIGFLEIMHWVILKGPITLTSLFVISNTNIQEAVEFFSLKATLGLFLLLPYIFLFIISLKNIPKIQKSKSTIYITILVLLTSTIFITENIIHHRLVRKGVPQIVKVTCSFIDKINLYREAMQDIAPKNIEAHTSINTEKQTFVLIIGESCSRRHMSLYGASRNTNPLLTQEDNIIVYNDVVSPYSNTLNSVLTILSQSNLDKKIDFGQGVDIFDIFHSAGFKTYWISNQSPIGIWDNLVTVFAKKSDYSKFVNTSSNSSFEAILTTSYDSKLFTPFVSALNDKADKKLIILHLMGSHSSYSKRYPNNFDIFKGENKKEQLIAEYDNSILYNDYIVDSIINILDKNTTLGNNISSMIYLSDHAENVYDEYDKTGHDFAKILPRVNVEIPFLVWLSPKYQKLLSNKTMIIKQHANKPFVSDDLFHCIMDINGIASPYFIDTKSIFNNNYDSSRKRILVDGKDYDKK